MEKDAPYTLILLPVFLLIVLIVAVIGFRSPLVQVLVQIPLALIYPFKLRSDAKHVSKRNSGWKPNVTLYTLYGILVAITLGTLSLVVSPYYLYRRK